MSKKTYKICYRCNEATYLTIKAVLAYVSSKAGRQICYSEYVSAFYMIARKTPKVLKDTVFPAMINVLKHQV